MIRSHNALDAEEQGFLDALVSEVDLDAGIFSVKLTDGSQEDAATYIDGWRFHRPWHSADDLGDQGKAQLVRLMQARQPVSVKSERTGRLYNPSTYQIGSYAEDDGIDGPTFEIIPTGDDESRTHFVWLAFTQLRCQDTALEIKARQFREMGRYGVVLRFDITRANTRFSRKQVDGEWVNDYSGPRRIDWGHWSRDNVEYITPLVAYRSFYEPGAVSDDLADYRRCRWSLANAHSDSHRRDEVPEDKAVEEDGWMGAMQ